MKWIACWLFLILCLALPATVLALGFETFGNDPVVKQPDWAEGVVDVVNSRSRVYNQWVNGNESFYFRGKAKDVNEALRSLAAVKADVRRVILLPGAGSTKTFGGKPIAFDWKVHVPSGIYKAVATNKHAEMTIYLAGTKPRPVDRKPIDKWLADLNSESFKVREEARLQLEKVGNDAKPFLRDALKANPPSLEAGRRIESLLDRLTDLDISDLVIPKGLTVITADDLISEGLKELKHEDAPVGGLALAKLAPLAPYSDKVLPAIVGLLPKENTAYTRRLAAAWLGQLGVEAKSAVPMLKQGLEDPDSFTRTAFQAALTSIENAKAEPGQEARNQREQAVLDEIRVLKKNLDQSR